MAKLFLCNFHKSVGFKILYTLREPQTKRVSELVLKCRPRRSCSFRHYYVGLNSGASIRGSVALFCNIFLTHCYWACLNFVVLWCCNVVVDADVDDDDKEERRNVDGSNKISSLQGTALFLFPDDRYTQFSATVE